MDRHEIDQFGHRLIDNGDEHLERRINRKAVKYALIRSSKGEDARKLTLHTELLTLCLRYFRVVGQGVSRNGPTFDNVLVDELYWCLEHFSASKGSFTHLVRFRYRRQSITSAEQEYKIALSVDSLDEEGHEDAVAEDQPSLEDHSSERVNGMLAEFISLVVDFLGHLPDRKHNERAKLYLRMNFTEWATYSVKVQPLFEDCEPFESQEDRIFATAEIPFLDLYMAQACRSIRALWDCGLKEGFGTILCLDDPALQVKNPPAPWKLPVSIHLDYASSRGFNVTSAVISQHRKKFDLLKEELVRRS